MGQRKVIVKESVADSIAEIAWFIESKGMVATAEKFADSVYDFFINLSDSRKRYAPCRDTGNHWIQMHSLQKKVHCRFFRIR